MKTNKSLILTLVFLLLINILLINIISSSSIKANAASINLNEVFDFNIGDIVIFSGEAYFSSMGDLPKMTSSFGLYRIEKKNTESPYPYAIVPLGGKTITGWTSDFYLTLYEPNDLGHIFKAKLDANIRTSCSVWTSEIYTILPKDAFISIYDIIENEGRAWGKTRNEFFISVENLELIELDEKEKDKMKLGIYKPIRTIQLRNTSITSNRTGDTLYKHETIEVLSIFWNEIGIRCGKVKYNKKICYVYMDSLVCDE